MFLRVLAFLSFLVAAPLSAQSVDAAPGSIVEKVRSLRPGEYIWAPQIAPAGPTLLLVNIRSQRAILYRNGIPIGATTVSTGRPGFETPTGVFSILQKQVEHYSAKYDNAPMPYMQRLTWYGVALHAGYLPGRPASHGCIRLPLTFAKELYGVTRLGMTVVITNAETSPRLMPLPTMTQAPALNNSEVVWRPQMSPDGPVSIIVSAADGRGIVLRNGVEIGSGPVIVSGPVEGTWAYVMRDVGQGNRLWFRVPLSVSAGGEGQINNDEWQRFSAPETFKRAVASVIVPGTTIVVTADSLREGAAGTALTVIEAGPRKE